MEDLKKSAEVELEEIPSFTEDDDGFVHVYTTPEEDMADSQLEVYQTQGLYRAGNVS